ncbi:TonB-dependent receptor [Cellvibrio sp. pealriver]|uniref:TonB-dependent receptor n=1 Tax=Cellvibrio sp. pealriver TaxID=1622269 RepID=UPI00066FCC33|nr:TonB-dependent receptor [Cellvibrio sp. pealriver]
MYKTISFKKKLLATAVTAAVASLSGMTYAQDDSVEEVMVTGIRASVAQAMDTKRNAVGVVDAISAEDIGKMPDSNLAESLQRISGLSINRSDGEGSQVTARGIGAELNMVTLNGRVMPAVANSNTGDSSTRAYDFANLASESVFGVEVYKTGRADVATGGLGATINIKTLRPLEAGSRASIGVKAIQDETVRSGAGDEITPEVSGMGSWVNDEDTFGVAVSGSYQRRDSSNANNFVNNWANLNTWDDTSTSRFKSGVVINNAPDNGDLYALPTDLRYEVQDNKRERTNAQAIIQFKPTERLTTTLDYTFSELDRVSERAQQSVWFNVDAISELTFDNGAVRTPVIYRESYLTNGVSRLKDVSFAAGHVDSLTQNNSLGLNVAFEVNDQLKLTLDHHNSSANNNSQGIEVGLNANIITSEYVDWSKDMPLMSVTTDDCILRQRAPRDDYYSGNCNGVIDGGDVSGAMTNNPRSHTRTEIEQTQLIGEFQFNGSGFFENAGLKFGIEQRKDLNSSRASGDNRQGVGNWDGIDPAEFPDQYFESRDFGKDFPDYGSTTKDDLFFVGVDANLPKIIETAEAINASGKYPQDFYGFVNGKVQWNGIYTTNRTIEEESKSAFTQFNSNFELGGLESNLVVGLRYEETDVTSSSLVNEPTILWWESDNDWSVVYAAEKTQQRKTGSYDYLLPNIDFDISPTDSLKLRFSYSETIGRPSYADLRPDVGLNSLLQRTANAGDAGLKPMESQNVDVSAEWYYTDDSYVSLGYFRKDVDGFIGTQIFNETAYGLRDVRLGQTAIASGIPQVNEEALHTYVLANSDPAFISSNGRWVRADNDDPLLIWQVNKPVNDKSAVIDGLEVAAQHWFGESGFGVQANYTMVDADVEFDNLTTAGQFAMTGLSDTANVVGFYDKDAWQIRLAYNWRDSFLLSRTAGGGNQPQYVEAYSQIDLSIGYEFSDNLTFTAEGINVTGENYRTHGRSEAQLLSLEDLGARYQVGLRYTF